MKKLLARVLPTLNRRQRCPACGDAFACEIGLQGCWCVQVDLSPATLKALKNKYNGCLCRSCLEEAEAQSSEFKFEREA